MELGQARAIPGSRTGMAPVLLPCEAGRRHLQIVAQARCLRPLQRALGCSSGAPRGGWHPGPPRLPGSRALRVTRRSWWPCPVLCMGGSPARGGARGPLRGGLSKPAGRAPRPHRQRWRRQRGKGAPGCEVRTVVEEAACAACGRRAVRATRARKVSDARIDAH